MEKIQVERFVNSGWLYLSRKNGFFYKCKIIELTDEYVTIIDRNGLTSMFPHEEIVEISVWREK